MQSRAAGRPAETEQHNKNNPLTVLSSGTKTASLSVTSRPEQLATLMAHNGPAGLLLRRLPLQHFTALSTAIIQQTATRSNRAAAPELQTHGTSVVTLSHSLSLKKKERFPTPYKHGHLVSLGVYSCQNHAAGYDF